MNLSTKCNCCIKEDVCKIKENYIKQVKTIERELAKLTNNENIEYSIKCKKFNSGKIFG